jgi:DNA (cytosine-5)-methyltransferase 1
MAVSRSPGKPRLLDLFSGAGGAAMGYSRAGFDVVGVDIQRQPRYCGIEFVCADALDVLGTSFMDSFDAIHASPPCQAYSTATRDHSKHPDLYEPVRDLLEASGLPWVIENVPQAPYRTAVTLCGSMFGLKVRRHRIFESSFPIEVPACDHQGQGQPWGVYGDGGGTSVARVGGGSRGRKAKQSDWAELMEMPWATPQEIKEAIPPRYTQYVGTQLMAHLIPK